MNVPMAIAAVMRMRRMMVPGVRRVIHARA
jgi:hypothetical protein